MNERYQMIDILQPDLTIWIRIIRMVIFLLRLAGFSKVLVMGITQKSFYNFVQ